MFALNDRKSEFFGLDDLAKVCGGWKLPFGPNSFTPFWPKMAKFGPKQGSKRPKPWPKNMYARVLCTKSILSLCLFSARKEVTEWDPNTNFQPTPSLGK